MAKFIPDTAAADLAALELSMDDNQLALMNRYLDLLFDQNTRMNLTAVRDRDLAWHRLILDSLALMPGLDLLEAGSRIIDVGTGGGIPGIPLAIMQPKLHFTLLDATGKKIRFVQHAIDSLELSHVTAIQDRSETVGHIPKHRQAYDAALSRAVGSVAEVLEYTLPLVKVGGRVLLLKGDEAQKQLSEAGDALIRLGAGDVSVFEAYPNRGQGKDGCDLVVISILKDQPTPSDLPRRPGMAKSDPL